MDGFKIIDMAGDRDSRFTSGGLILITGITESNLRDAITITESAKASENVTAGILSGSINPLHQNMRRLSEIADAVILSPGKFEDPSRAITDSISDLVTKNGFVNIDIKDVNEILKNAGTVYFGTGTAKDSSTAAKTASKNFPPPKKTGGFSFLTFRKLFAPPSYSRGFSRRKDSVFHTRRI